VATPGALKALDATTGEELWQAELRFGIHTAPPVVQGEGVLLATGRGELIAVEAESGAELWRVGSDPALLELGPYRRGGPSSGAAPALGDGFALFGADDGLLRIVNLADGAVLGQLDLASPITGCAVSGRLGFATTYGGLVVALEPILGP
jgi:outer membrane protein assembly factor BamB